jgi:hypothetical protein
MQNLGEKNRYATRKGGVPDEELKMCKGSTDNNEEV